MHSAVSPWKQILLQCRNFPSTCRWEAAYIVTWLNVNMWKEAGSNLSASASGNLHWTVAPLIFVEVCGGLEVLCAHLFLFSHAGSSPWRLCACCACWRRVWLCSCLLIPGEIRSGHRLEVLQIVFLDSCYPSNSLWHAQPPILKRIERYRIAVIFLTCL